MTTLNLDYEVYSEVDLKTHGLDRYASDPSTRVLMVAYTFNRSRDVHFWSEDSGEAFPTELVRALRDPSVIKSAFNAQFERIITQRVLKIQTGYANWYCTMARAYLLSFTGTLGEIGEQMELGTDKVKDVQGKRLIRLFCMPQRVTRNQPFTVRNALTDPEDWELFCNYCKQDVVAECEIENKLSKFPIPDDEWRMYQLDQRINDRGLPINLTFAQNALAMAAIRKQELLTELQAVTRLANPNSTAQLLPWLQDRGYPFSDLQKDTVKKVLKECADTLHPDAQEALQLRQNANRTSIAKYNAFDNASGVDGEDHVMRYAFQFAGAARTARWAGRRVQAQNLPRTPKEIEQEDILAFTTGLIEQDNLNGLRLMVGEPMTALVGCIRSTIQAPTGQELRVCDLSSIETCVIAWLANCERLLRVIRSGYDAYKDFAVILYKKVYADFGTPEYEASYSNVSKVERTNSKPAVLGAGYRLGGGDLVAGKRTGLWGYAENMGINLSKEEAHSAVNAYRENYPEVPALWRNYEDAIKEVIDYTTTRKVGCLHFSYRRPFLMVLLPSGRYMYYFKPRMMDKTFTKTVGHDEQGNPIIESWTKRSFSYMGQDQASGKWTRIYSHGGKLTENFVQAIARDILRDGLLDADSCGFDIRGHVHDEIIVSQFIDDTEHTVEALGDCMTRSRKWAQGLPLGYGGWAGRFYRKD